MTKLRIEYDDTESDIIEKVNNALDDAGIKARFVINRGESTLETVVWDLVTTSAGMGKADV